MLVRTFAMNHSIGEVVIKQQWRVRRQFQSTSDAERRWDQATGMDPSEPVSARLPPFPSLARAEVRYEDVDLYASVDEPSDPGSNHWAAAGDRRQLKLLADDN